ncbi:MAG TPA: ribosome-associated translation inhibitor RaiA [Planctomycetota bacterium]|nr:ribosome-associated translation inhibitor RaiA [Planctomycetota bacterium]
MELQITGRHTSVTDAMKAHASEKLAKLERHNDMVTRAEVVMNIENEQRHIVEMIAHTKVGGRLVAKAEHTDMYAAVDLLLDKMDQQIVKQKEKIKDERKHSRTKASGAKAAGGRQTGSSEKGRPHAESEAAEDESDEM